ncbi:hypothetical protein KUTeg_003480 [Tegillarca granosa]|uniref:Branchpoint-bridging protein n=1 Tax=Tegillarca granosa TaxID=220873 RepID=A0ABQ9FM91_TEGGR|nr:hypothetical protein KUTeg_003480 [Tegillarca granosa]
MFSNPGKRPLEFNNPGDWMNPNGAATGDASDRKKKRKSRWATEQETDKTIIPGMPTVIPTGLSTDQERQYLLHLQIEEISRRLRTGDLGISPNPEDRSPSPEPIYNNEGKRLNTREYRTRKKLEEDRHRLVQEAMDLNAEYKPPADYKPPVVRVSDKVMIPQDEHPEINFVGLLIGPRGNTLKNLEKDTGAKIIIRGKGSVKEGKIGRKDGQPLPGEDEPLHAYVTANNPENVKKAVEKIKEIIHQGIEVPEGQNDLRRQQLRELALLNGTLRENDGLAKLKQLQQAQTIITNTIICTVCGGTGHIAQDCKAKRPGDTLRGLQPVVQPPQTQADKAKMDSEYMSLMAELGEGPPPKPDPMPPNMPHMQPQQQFRPPISQPPPNPMAINPPWGHQPNSINRPPPPPVMSQPSQPPPYMPGQMSNVNIQAVQPPVGSMASQGQQPPQNFVSSSMPAPVAPPSMFTSSAGGPPMSWQQPVNTVSSHPSTTTSANVGGGGGVPPPPPNTTNSNQAPWQPAVAPPPPPSSNLPPWQQGPHQVAPPLPNPMAPPPPPPTSQGFGGPGMAPPPPPPGGFNVNQLGGVGQFLGAPPPPPPS